MNRRSALKNISLVTGSVITLPAWMMSCGISDKNTHQSGFSSTEQEILAFVTDTIIPAGSSVGALSVGVDRFLQKLIDDCYEKPIQDNIKKQLLALDITADEDHNKSFSECTQQQREKLLLKLEDSADKDEKEFFALIKTETIRGFNTSQKVMEEYLNYKIAPGYYNGCVPV